MKAIFCISGIALMIYLAAADSLLDKLGFVGFGLLGLALAGAAAVSSKS